MPGLQVQTIGGFPEGANLTKAINELSDTECRYAQDVLFSDPALTQERGKLVADFTGGVGAMALITSYNGSVGTGGSGQISASLSYSSSSGQWSFWNGNGLAKGVSAISFGAANTRWFQYDTKPNLDGTTFFGHDFQGTPYATIWHGGISPVYNTGTITVAAGSQTITGVGTTWGQEMSGCFLFATIDDDTSNTNVFLGEVGWTNTTTLSLNRKCPFAVTARAYTLSATRSFNPKMVKGRITVATTSATVTGANTKFVDGGLGTGKWYIFKSDGTTYVGKVSTITNNTSLQMAANGLVSMSNERFVAVRVDNSAAAGTWTNARFLGCWSGIYAGRQWYASSLSNNVYFSDVSDMEAVDLSTADGDFIKVVATSNVDSPVRGLASTFNALLVYKDTETIGIFGNSTSNFRTQKILDDGALSANVIQVYQGGAVWAGRKGIYFYNGTDAVDLAADKLGPFYTTLVGNWTYDNNTDGNSWSYIHKDHYFLHLYGATPSRGTIKGSTYNAGDTKFTLVINLKTKAFSFLTNFGFRGAVDAGGTTGKLVLFTTTSNGLTGTAKLCKGDRVFDFDTVGFDAFTTEGASGTTYPDPYIETKRFDGGDPQLKKLFKQLNTYYKLQGFSNPSFEKDTSSWVATTNATISRDTTNYYQGSAAAKVVTTGIAVGEGLTRTVTTATGIPIVVQPSTTYSMTATINAPLGSNVILQAKVYTSGLGLLTSPSVSIAGTGGFQTYTLSVPVGATGVYMFPLIVTAVSAQAITFYVDEVTIDNVRLQVDTIVGLDDSGIAARSTYAPQNFFKNKRIKFLKRGQFIGFRIYKQVLGAPTSLHIGSLGLGYKTQRPGRP